MSRVASSAAVIAFLGAGMSIAHAATAEQQCQAGRYKAAAQYAACHTKFFAKYFGGGSLDQKKLSRCHEKYRATWAKLQAKASGTAATCDAARFQDNGDGTVTDRLTGLMWEKKTDAGDIHDMDVTFNWSDNEPNADGDAYDLLLAILNGGGGGCFAGQCDWRLPTLAELQTLLLGGYVCVTTPCVDEVFGPMFGVTNYWSSTTDALAPSDAWTVGFYDGSVAPVAKQNPSPRGVRAVRGGL